MSLRKVIFWLSACLLLCPVVTVAVYGHDDDDCPCFSEDDLKEQISIIRDLAAAEGRTTAEDIEVRIRLGDVELEGRFEVKAIPDEEPLEDTFTNASVNEISPISFSCGVGFFILDEPQIPETAAIINRGEAEACLGEMLKAFEDEVFPDLDD
jgi:hypothetical protein